MSELDSRAEAIDRAIAEDAMRRHGEPIVVTTTPSVLVDTLVIAAAFARILKYYDPVPLDDCRYNRFIGIIYSADVIADAIQPTDGAFDRQTFLKLCGVPK